MHPSPVMFTSLDHKPKVQEPSLKFASLLTSYKIIFILLLFPEKIQVPQLTLNIEIGTCRGKIPKITNQSPFACVQLAKPIPWLMQQEGN